MTASTFLRTSRPEDLDETQVSKLADLIEDQSRAINAVLSIAKHATDFDETAVSVLRMQDQLSRLVARSHNFKPLSVQPEISRN